MEALSVLSIFDTSKAQRVSFATDVINRIKEGLISPLKAHIQIKAMEDMLSNLTDRKTATGAEYMQLVLEEAYKVGNKFELYNTAFQIKETGVKYDYSKCGHPEWNQLKSEMIKLEERLKTCELFLKTIPAAGMEIMDRETGELVTVYPPSKTSTTSVAVSMK